MYAPCCGESVKTPDIGDLAREAQWVCPKCATTYKMTSTKKVKVAINQGDVMARTHTFRKVA